jgi:hypothetical protein
MCVCVSMYVSMFTHPLCIEERVPGTCVCMYVCMFIPLCIEERVPGIVDTQCIHTYYTCMCNKDSKGNFLCIMHYMSYYCAL